MLLEGWQKWGRHTDCQEPACNVGVDRMGTVELKHPQIRISILCIMDGALPRPPPSSHTSVTISHGHKLTLTTEGTLPVSESDWERPTSNPQGSSLCWCCAGGGYVVGRADLVEAVGARLAAPGISTDAGQVSGDTLRILFQVSPRHCHRLGLSVLGGSSARGNICVMGPTTGVTSV